MAERVEDNPWQHFRSESYSKELIQTRQLAVRWHWTASWFVPSAKCAVLPAGSYCVKAAWAEDTGEEAVWGKLSQAED